MTLNEYKELIKTRNSLLRALSEGNGGADQLDYWDSKLVQLGAKLIIERKNLIERLNPIMNAKAKSKFNEKLNILSLDYCKNDLAKDIQVILSMLDTVKS